MAPTPSPTQRTVRTRQPVFDDEMLRALRRARIRRRRRTQRVLTRL